MSNLHLAGYRCRKVDLDKELVVEISRYNEVGTEMDHFIAYKIEKNEDNNVKREVVYHLVNAACICLNAGIEMDGADFKDLFAILKLTPAVKLPPDNVLFSLEVGVVDSDSDQLFDVCYTFTDTHNSKFTRVCQDKFTDILDRQQYYEYLKGLDSDVQPLQSTIVEKQDN